MAVTDDPRRAAQIRQLLADRETAQAQGIDDRVRSVDKHLAALGYTRKPRAQTSSTPPQERQAPAKATADHTDHEHVSARRKTRAKGDDA